MIPPPATAALSLIAGCAALACGVDLSAPLIPLAVLLHAAAAPYTKVEESFTIQAVHDILAHGVPTEDAAAFFAGHYDHVSFPGAVPRTFTGAVVLAGLSKPWMRLVEAPEQRQLVVRLVLGSFNAAALLLFRDAVSKTFGRPAGRWYALLQAGQFHVVYYASRTLPNMVAFGMTTIALRSLMLASQYGPRHAWAARHNRLALYVLTFAGVVFRSELAILVATHAVFLLLQRRASLAGTILPAALAGALVGLATSVSIDSFFWQQIPLWPEWTGFYYNTVLGRSSAWGVSPWHHYFATALPKLLLNPATVLVCLPTALLMPALRSRSLALLAPNLAFVALYSFLPHKEWRFVVYVVPALTAVAAAGASWIWTRRSKSLLYAAISLVLAVSVIASFAASALLLALSSLNYPGGEALARLHALQRNATASAADGVVRVHLDNLSCQTGVTRFLQLPAPAAGWGARGPSAPWAYDKTDDDSRLLDPAFWAPFDFALAEDPARVIGSWEVLDVAYGFGGLKLVRPGADDGDGDGAEEVELHLSDGRDVRAHVGPPKRYDARWFVWLRRLEDSMRSTLTRGWWLRVRMEPKVWILRQQR